jgi:hypothetical protein
VITGEGTAHFWGHESIDGKGVVHFNGGESIHGKATDDNGGDYVFNYHDASSGTFTGFPFVVHLTDHFNLTGPGDVRIHTFFVADVTITGPGPNDMVFDAKVVIGDPINCDPL